MIRMIVKHHVSPISSDIPETMEKKMKQENGHTCVVRHKNPFQNSLKSRNRSIAKLLSFDRKKNCLSIPGAGLKFNAGSETQLVNVV